VLKALSRLPKAMKMVAAAKLRRAQESVINARPYARKISELISHLVNRRKISLIIHFIVQREIKNIAYVVVTADRGLCGAFNNNILKEATRQLNISDASQPGCNISCLLHRKKKFRLL